MFDRGVLNALLDTLRMAQRLAFMQGDAQVMEDIESAVEGVLDILREAGETEEDDSDDE